MPKPSQPRKTTSRAPVPAEAALSAGPAADTPTLQSNESPATLSDADDLKPWIEVLAPPDNADISGSGEVGVVVGYVRAERAAPDIQLGNVVMSVDGVSDPTCRSPSTRALASSDTISRSPTTSIRIHTSCASGSPTAGARASAIAL